MRWGVLAGSSGGYHAPFWQAAQAVHIYDIAVVGAGIEPREAETVHLAVQAATFATLLGTDGVHAVGAGLASRTAFDSMAGFVNLGRLLEYLSRVQSDLKKLPVVNAPAAGGPPFPFSRNIRIVPGSSSSISGRGCCVLEFSFPRCAEPTKDPIGWIVKFGAVYDDKPPCECDCCIFMYYVKFFHVNPTRDKMTDSNSVHTEDCQVKKTKGGTAVGNFAEGRTAGSDEYYDCYPQQYSNARPDQQLPSDPGSCKWEYTDNPNVPDIEADDPHFLMWDYLGIIYDMCNNWEVKRIERFVLVSGDNGGGAHRADGKGQPLASGLDKIASKC